MNERKDDKERLINMQIDREKVRQRKKDWMNERMKKIDRQKEQKKDRKKEKNG